MNAFSFIKKGVYVELLLTDKTKLAGMVRDCRDEAFDLQDNEGSILHITFEEIAKAVYLYTGFPTEKVLVQTPIRLKGNGTITSYDRFQGFVDGRKYIIHSDSFLIDDELKRTAAQHPGQLAGREVLYITRYKNQINKAFLLSADTLDKTLDNIAVLAKSDLAKARDFCKLLSKQFPDDVDVKGFLEQIHNAERVIDFYKPVLTPLEEEQLLNDGNLVVLGRIYDINERDGSGHIVDVRSHKKLFFFKEQLLDNLRNRKKEELIGLPVVYSITPNPNKENEYQARSIMPPMHHSKAFEMAERMMKGYMKPTACDILRIIKNQGFDDYDSVFMKWSYRVNLWKSIQLADYLGDEEELVLRKKSGTPISLVRSMEHTHMEESMAPPVPPIIAFDLPSGGEQEQNEPSTAPSEAVKAPTVLTSELPEPEKSETKEPKTEAKTITNWNIINSWVESNKQKINANARMTFHYDEGVLYDIHDMQKTYSFTLDDIIDSDLRTEAEKKRFMSNDYICEREVVCQLFESGGRHARNICVPCNVDFLLKQAYTAFQTVVEEEKYGEDALSFFNHAEGYLSIILNAYPHHVAAIEMQSAISKEKAKRDFHKAPDGVIPTGRISTLKCDKNRLTISDPMFKKAVVFDVSEIVDKQYTKRHSGDELMYAVYEEDGKLFARYVHRALPTTDLIRMAEEWAEEGETEKAWGIAMNILDANPNDIQAKRMVADYESRRNASSGDLLVGEATREARIKRIGNDLLAQARLKRQQKDYVGALQLYAQELENHEAKGDSKGIEIAWCIRESIEIYSERYHENPTDEEWLKKYKDFGLKYIQGSGGLANRARPLEKNLRIVIQYYQDMGKIDLAIESINKLVTISRLGSEKDDAINLRSKAEAQKAWELICYHTDIEKAESLTKESLKSDNELAHVCNAVLKERLDDKDKEIRANDRITPHTVNALRKYTDQRQGNGSFNLISERFDQLCQIVALQERLRTVTTSRMSLKDELTTSLSNYLATVLYNEDGYLREKESLLPADCRLALLLNECMKKDAAWPCWNEVRLVAMLSEEAAYIIGNMLWNLDKDFAINLLRAQGMEFKYNNKNVRADYYARIVGEWRGESYYQLYEDLIKREESLTLHSNSPHGFADFFSRLKIEPWMLQDDKAVIQSLQHRMPQLIKKFEDAIHDRSAVNYTSRSIILTHRALKEFTDIMTAFIRERPTVLSTTVLLPILSKVTEMRQQVFDAIHFECPEPNVKIISTSKIDADGSIIIEVEVSNVGRTAFPMRNCKLTVNSIENGLLKDKPVTYSDSSAVYGGESLIYILEATLDTFTDSKLQLCFTYLHNNNDVTKDYSLPIIVEKWSDAMKLKDVYNPGGVVKDEKGFFGRKDEIEDVVSHIDMPDCTHYFIYGQKRCGKSSLLYHIETRLESLNKYVCVHVDFLDLKFKKENDIYKHMIELLYFKLLPIMHPPFDFPEEDVAYHDFCRILNTTNDYLKKTGCRNKVVFSIDEFTKVYLWYKNGVLSKEFFSRWKAIQSQGLFSAVLIGQDVLNYILRDLVSNDWAGFLYKRLTYLQPEDARRLITEPIANGRNDTNIFIGKAVERILYYSDYSAFFTQYICSLLVEYVNSRHLAIISEADVEDCIRKRFARHEQSDNYIFDALEYAGQDPHESDFEREQTKEILRQVVYGELNDLDKGCPKGQISSSYPDVDVKKLLAELVERLVLAVENDFGNDFYKINVKLYLIWTITHDNLS